ncbi:MAG: type II toxin-antitoxin system HicA family toxin [Thermoanaerobaculia bacterium]
MSRLPTVKPRRVVRALRRAGFEEHHQRGSHLYLRHPESRRMTSVPMHPGDLPKGTLRAILRQVEITVEEFVELLL